MNKILESKWLTMDRILRTEERSMTRPLEMIVWRMDLTCSHSCRKYLCRTASFESCSSSSETIGAEAATTLSDFSIFAWYCMYMCKLVELQWSPVCVGGFEIDGAKMLPVLLYFEYRMKYFKHYFYFTFEIKIIIGIFINVNIYLIIAPEKSYLGWFA